MRGQGTERGSRRKSEEKDAAQPIGGQARSADEEDRMEEQERAPSFLSARELLAQDPKPAGKEPARGAPKRVHRLLSDDEEGSPGKADDQDAE